MYFRIALIILALVTNIGIAQENLSLLVNPFIGTGGNGHTFPGVVMPFGMVQVSPDTRNDGSWEGCGGYHYSDNTILGFSHTHLSGAGVSDWGDILLSPSPVNKGLDPNSYSSTFNHTNEEAHAGYYAVKLDNGVDVKLTATSRVGFHRYHFPGKEGYVYIDLLHRDKTLNCHIEQLDSFTLQGYRISEAWAKEQHCYFTIRFNQPIHLLNISQQQNFEDQKPNNIGACVGFIFHKDTDLEVKVALSSVDNKGSAYNLYEEARHWGFDAYKSRAEKKWNDQLSKISITEENKDNKIIFYTALYHSFIHPSLDMDVDGRYRGRDHKIHVAADYVHYNVFSLWDTYRALHPLFTLIEKKRTNDFIQTFYHQFEEDYRLPVWELSSNETNCMIGYHSVSVITDAFMKGIKGYDTLKLYKAMLASTETDQTGIKTFLDKRFLEVNDESESVSKSLEYAYDNWCIAQMANRMKDKSNYKKLMQSSLAYKNLFDIKFGMMRPRQNGNWYSPFIPEEINNHYTEGNSWHYSFYVPHDIKGLIQLHGSETAFEKKLDELFTTKNKTTGRKQADVTGLIGQYAHGNEPSHHSPFLYHYLGKPEKTSERVNQILNDFYKNSPDGLIGNDDCGQMSAWYVLASIGLYQVCPGDNQFELFQPKWIDIRMHFENGKEFHIISKCASSGIKNYSLNKKRQTKSFLWYPEIVNGGELKLNFNDTESKAFGVSPSDRPQSAVTDITIVPTPIIKYSSKTFNSPMKIELIPINSNNETIYYTTNGNAPTTKSAKYKSAFTLKYSSQVKVIAYSNNDSSIVADANLFRRKEKFIPTINSNVNKQYSADGPSSLMDGVYGDIDWRKGEWIGVQGESFECVIKSRFKSAVKSLSADFLQDTRSWIIFPKNIKVYGSNDGKNYTLLGEAENTIDAKDYTNQTQKLIVTFTQKWKYKYYKLVAENFGKLPEWHNGRGGEAFIFIDEVELN